MHASSLAGAAHRRVAPAVSCSLRPSLPQVGLCLLQAMGFVCAALRAPLIEFDSDAIPVPLPPKKGSWMSQANVGLRSGWSTITPKLSRPACSIRASPLRHKAVVRAAAAESIELDPLEK
jgi:hypothetical protein